MSKRSKQFELRCDLLEGWAYGHHFAGGGHGELRGGLDTMQHVFFAKFIERYHPDLALNPAETAMTACLEYPVRASVVDAIEAHLPEDETTVVMWRAVAHGVAVAYEVRGSEDTSAVLESTAQAVAEIISNGPVRA